ncbi:MAG: hypothetical protein HZB23_00480 [Deltaproteobacteria bacterium]|nr:hypothetical protein [Deltaproteobacteria bacterium]
MGRRDQWKQVQDSMYGEVTRARSVEERENVPATACGFCKNFAENAYASDGRGLCKILKMGSNILSAQPVFVTEGEVGHPTMFNTEAARCTYFERMDFIDTDGNEVADPSYRRVQRQMESKGK